MDVNYWAVLVCGIVAMGVGFTWYGPIFGKKWMEMNKGGDTENPAGLLYVVQFLLALFQAYVLAHFIQAWVTAPGVETALWIWIAFVMPTIASSAMWTADSSKVKWTKFFIQTGYNLVIFVVFAVILSGWR